MKWAINNYTTVTEKTDINFHARQILLEKKVFFKNWDFVMNNNDSDFPFFIIFSGAVLMSF